MRLDKFLKVSRIIKRRTVAKESVEKGFVLVNGNSAKASTEIKVGDLISYKTKNYKVLNIFEYATEEKAKTMYREED